MPHPLITQTAQACVLSATSNILAQGIEAYQADAAFQLRLKPILIFVLFSIISTPPNILWQEYLESKFPSNKKVVEKGGKEDKLQVKETLDIGNTIRKFVLDQTFGAVVNTLMFIAYTKGINGANSSQMIQAFKDESIPLWAAGLKIWPLVSVLSFTVIPPGSRIVFGSAAGVVWGIYLSLVASRA